MRSATRFLHNISGNNSIVNTMAINEDNVLVSGSDNGKLHFWDWKSGHNFHTSQPAWSHAPSWQR